MWNNGGMAAEHSSDVIDRDGFRANVGIVLARGAGELFLGGRVGGRGWQFPQGGVNRGESAEDALFRELAEEIGLGPQDVEVLGSTRGWLRYRLPRQYVRDRCIGQKQRWFLLRLLSPEASFRFDTTSQPEFDRWRWVDYWTPIREVVYFKRRVYLRALHDLAPLLFADGPPPYPEWWAEVDPAAAKPLVSEARGARTV
jgi:putative (di)nucleoside polyphosphate hydrolase